MLITEASYVIQKTRTGHEFELGHKRAHECNFVYSVSIARNSCLVPMLLPEHPAGQRRRSPAHASRRPESGARHGERVDTEVRNLFAERGLVDHLVDVCSQPRPFLLQQKPCSHLRRQRPEPSFAVNLASVGRPARRASSSWRSRLASFLTPEQVTDGDFYSISIADYSDTQDGLGYSGVGGASITDGLSNTRSSASSITPMSESTTSLHRNLLRLLHDPIYPPQLSVALHYHNSHPIRIRSARSYNLLLEVAIRSTYLSTARRLFTEMRTYDISGNIETLKLHVRLLVLTGHWTAAWDMAIRSPSHQYPRSRLAGLGSVKRGKEILYLSGSSYFVLGNELHPIDHALSEDLADSLADSKTIQASQFRKLMTAVPKLTPKESAKVPVRVIYHMAMTMLRLGQRGSAREIVDTYLRSLSPNAPYRRWRACLDVVHLFVRFTPTSRGLKRHHEALQSCQELLNCHSSLCATSTTLHLLLGTLHRTLHCGTAGYKLLCAFKSKWGPRVEDRRVRRKIASYALKEGRLDIVKLMIDAEKGSRVEYGVWRTQTEALGSSSRVPTRRCRRRVLLAGRGKEEAKWRKLISKVRKKLGE
ncbi:Tethering factor for nuclear proteasome STS [Salix suchowensis]|nr:Tethering factor for nuclear proteasome STS [Salix suchowensis]